MEHLLIILIFILFAVIASFMFDSWGENLLKRKNKYTVKYDEGKQITFYKNGKIVKQKLK
jgi:hypothetical protein|tara:strand:+ start:712 stop:891 length:180 start_codon:yes stop_codon:yes gene_type:complete